VIKGRPVRATQPRKSREIPSGTEPLGISAGEFGFAYDSCARCWWDKKHGVAPVPEAFATVLRKSASAMEAAVTVEFVKAIGIPAVSEFPRSQVKSAPVYFHEVGRAGFIHGRLDRGFVCEDGSVALIECKCSQPKESRIQAAVRQLEAYAYALQNPSYGSPVKVSLATVLIWEPTEMKLDPATSRGVLWGGFTQHVARCDKSVAEERLEKAVRALTGARPASGRYCDVCRAVDERARKV